MKRIVYYDILNIAACFSVVVLHSNGAVHTYGHDSTWWLRCLYEVICYFAVPIFFMLSGATLLNYRERYTTKDYIKKRVHRAVIPFLFFSCSFLLLHLLILWRNGTTISLFDCVSIFCAGKIPMTHYWFFIPLFLLYVFIPFISILTKALDNKSILILASIIIVLQSLVWPIQTLLGLEESRLPMDGYVAYVLLGGGIK